MVARIISQERHKGSLIGGLDGKKYKKIRIHSDITDKSSRTEVVVSLIIFVRKIALNISDGLYGRVPTIEEVSSILRDPDQPTVETIVSKN